jgi:hypothetical protein
MLLKAFPFTASPPVPDLAFHAACDEDYDSMPGKNGSDQTAINFMLLNATIHHITANLFFKFGFV